MYFSYDLPEVCPSTTGLLNPGDGQVIVTAATKNRRKGTFKSTTNKQNGKIYTLEGTFDASVLNPNTTRYENHHLVSVYGIL